MPSHTDIYAACVFGCFYTTYRSILTDLSSHSAYMYFDADMVNFIHFSYTHKHTHTQIYTVTTTTLDCVCNVYQLWWWQKWVDGNSGAFYLQNEYKVYFWVWMWVAFSSFQVYNVLKLRDPLYAVVLFTFCRRAVGSIIQYKNKNSPKTLYTKDISHIQYIQVHMYGDTLNAHAHNTHIFYSNPHTCRVDVSI